MATVDRVFVAFLASAPPRPEFAAFRGGDACLRCLEMTRLSEAAGAIVDRIKINRVKREMRDARAVWIKQRRKSAVPVMMVANWFFRVVGNPVRALIDAGEWQSWEVDCFLHFHGENYRAFRCGPQAIGADELPGRSLSDHLDAKTLTAKMLGAAGRELRRAHEWRSAAFGSAWSHGDPHLGNFIFDPEDGRARLIDFEVMHHPSLSADERHADDLLVFLQDLMGRIRADDWIPFACAFLEGYGRAEIHELLGKRLAVPWGIARIWWAVRTTYAPRREIQRRCMELRSRFPLLTGARAAAAEGVLCRDPLANRSPAQ